MKEKQWIKSEHNYWEYRSVDSDDIHCPTVSDDPECHGLSCTYAWWKTYDWYPCPESVGTMEECKAYGLVMWRLS